MTPPVQVCLRSPHQTRELGRRLGAASRPGDLYLLFGSFGAGKTTLVQGLAAGLGVAEPVTSPSFVIETRYTGRLGLNHVDLYRLDTLSPELLEELEEHLFGDDVSAVEWPGLLPLDVQEAATRLRFSEESEEEEGDVRRVLVEGAGAHLAHVLEECGHAWPCAE